MKLEKWQYTYRFNNYLKHANQDQLNTLINLLKKNYNTFGEIVDAVEKGDFDYLPTYKPYI